MAAGLIWLAALSYAQSDGADLEGLAGTLSWLAPLVCVGSFLAIAALLTANLRHLRRLPRLLTGQQWAGLALILTMAIVTRMTWIPATDRLYFDEQVFVQVARGLRDEGRAGTAIVACIDGGDYQCDDCAYPKRPLAWPTLIALSALDGKPNSQLAHSLNLLLSAIAIIAVALLGALLLSKRHALPTAAIYAMIPANAAWSRAGASEVLAATLSVLLVLLALIVARNKRPESMGLLAAVMVMLAQSRNEALPLLGVAIIALVLFGQKQWPTSAFAIGSAVIVATIPMALHLGMQGQGYDPLAAGQVGLGLEYLPGNLVALWYYLGSEPVALGALGLAAFAVAVALPRRAAILLVSWLLIGLLPALLYVAGSTALPGGDRFIVAWVAPVAIAAAAALVSLNDRAPPPLRHGLIGAGIVLFAGALVWSTFHTADRDLRLQSPRGDVAFVHKAVAHLPEHSFVLTMIPSVVLNAGRSAAYLPSVDCDLGILVGRAAEDRLYLLETVAFAEEQTRIRETCAPSIELVDPPAMLELDDVGASRRLYRIRADAAGNSDRRLIDW
jgi:hypothetical protein